MKWFKHMANAGDDDFIEWLEETYGFEGTGRFWRICEKIAQEMDKHIDDPSVTHTWRKWQVILRGKRSQLLSFLLAIASRTKIIVEHDENILKIIIPKMLELRDNHTRNLQATAKSLTGDLFAEQEADKEEDKNTSPLPPSPSETVPRPRERIPVQSLRLEREEFKNVNSYAAAAASCEQLLGLRKLSEVDKAILSAWWENYDFVKEILPVMLDQTETFMENNYGKRPATISYFSKRVSERCSRRPAKQAGAAPPPPA